MTTKEPGGTVIGQQIRKILLNPKNKRLSIISELFLLLADRAQHVKEKIIPFIKKNYIVLSDRYADSTVAYQAAGRNLDSLLIKQLNKLCIDKAIPDLTFLMLANLKTTLKTAKNLSKEYKGGDRIEQESIQFHRKVKKEYNNLSKENPERFVKIKLQENINATQEMIQKKCLERLRERQIL